MLQVRRFVADFIIVRSIWPTLDSYPPSPRSGPSKLSGRPRRLKTRRKGIVARSCGGQPPYPFAGILVGTPLVVRHGTGNTLTSDGEAYHAEIYEALKLISTATGRLIKGDGPLKLRIWCISRLRLAVAHGHLNGIMRDNRRSRRFPPGRRAARFPLDGCRWRHPLSAPLGGILAAAQRPQIRVRAAECHSSGEPGSARQAAAHHQCPPTCCTAPLLHEDNDLEWVHWFRLQDVDPARRPWLGRGSGMPISPSIAARHGNGIAWPTGCCSVTSSGTDGLVEVQPASGQFAPVQFGGYTSSPARISGTRPPWCASAVGSGKPRSDPLPVREGKAGLPASPVVPNRHYRLPYWHLPPSPSLAHLAKARTPPASFSGFAAEERRPAARHVEDELNETHERSVELLDALHCEPPVQGEPAHARPGGRHVLYERRWPPHPGWHRRPVVQQCRSQQCAHRGGDPATGGGTRLCPALPDRPSASLRACQPPAPDGARRLRPGLFLQQRLGSGRKRAQTRARLSPGARRRLAHPADRP